MRAVEEGGKGLKCLEIEQYIGWMTNERLILNGVDSGARTVCAEKWKADTEIGTRLNALLRSKVQLEIRENKCAKDVSIRTAETLTTREIREAREKMTGNDWMGKIIASVDVEGTKEEKGSRQKIRQKMQKEGFFRNLTSMVEEIPPLPMAAGEEEREKRWNSTIRPPTPHILGGGDKTRWEREHCIWREYLCPKNNGTHIYPSVAKELGVDEVCYEIRQSDKKEVTIGNRRELIPTVEVWIDESKTKEGKAGFGMYVTDGHAANAAIRVEDDMEFNEVGILSLLHVLQVTHPTTPLDIYVDNENVYKNGIKAGMNDCTTEPNEGKQVSAKAVKQKRQNIITAKATHLM
jgi:hypothetical protein